MKSSLWFTAISLLLAAPSGLAKSELEKLRALSAEQERQIRQLAEENSKLRAGVQESAKPEQEAAAKPAVVEAVPTSTATPADVGQTYVVQAGDSFAKIARRAGSTAQKIADASGLEIDSVLHLGQKLTIPAATPPVATPVRNVDLEASGKVHTVQAGETFTSIAKKHGVGSAALMAANPTVQATSIRLGQVIRLPESPVEAGQSVNDSSVPSETVPVLQAPEALAPQVQAVEPTPAVPAPPVAQGAEEPKPAVKPAPAVPSKKYQAVVVERDMTFGEFAALHQTSTERLNELNGLDLSSTTILAKGSEIYLSPKP
ncbi:MAG: LysM peptidoglycan-binding domain-containing protein [Akkermansiaceae bacterium]|nr:LysM peptidoglycan-binding domain-containing protein [Akkermansiaceae bacterium]